MAISKTNSHSKTEKVRANRITPKSARRSVWTPALIFIVLTVLTIIMALALKALVTGSIRL